MSQLLKIRSEKILNIINHMSVGYSDIKKSGYYTFRFKDRYNNNLEQDYKLNPCQRVITYSQITTKTGYDKFKVRRSLLDLEKQGKIKIKKIYKIVKGWVTKEIVGHIVTLVPISITIKPLSLEKRKIEGKNISQKSVTPRDCLQTTKSAKNATLNIYLNNNDLAHEINYSALGLNIKSEDVDILKESDLDKINNFKKLDDNIKIKIKNIKTLINQKKSELNKEIKISIILSKQNKINQKSKFMNKNKTFQISKATSFDINPQGKKITLSDKTELKAIKVDENNLIPSKYKNQFLDLNFKNQKKVIEFYESLNLEIKMVDLIEKRKLISSIMIKFWNKKLSFTAVKSYLDEIKKIRSSHYKEQRVIYDYWGLFNSKVGAIGNKVELGYFESQWGG